MNQTCRCRLLSFSLFSALALFATPLTLAQWTVPTAEELSMTSQSEVPGAPAVYLFREETTEDKLHMFSTYVRLKVLTERGKEYANVELNYTHDSEGSSIVIDNIEGRTIHPDGSIIPFTGKPYDKLVQKTQGVRVMSKVFTLPDVEVGSIIEYRYKLRLDDNWFMAPQWFIQSSLYTRKAHYTWRPTDQQLISDEDGAPSTSISWTKILPAGAQLKQTQLPATGLSNGQYIFDLDVHDVPPAPEEDYMPPISSFTYRVLFYYAAYRSPDDFWKNAGKHWAKLQDKFIGPGPAVAAAVRDLVLPTDSQDQKLRKIYAAVMRLENTNYTREHSTAEEKSQGLKEVRNTDDIWTRKRGNNDQITALFVAMARAAGMKAYLGVVTNRDHSLFYRAYLSMSQLNDDIAIVNVDGKDEFFDPGSRYCPYQHLDWKHSQTTGLRQGDGGSGSLETPSEPYTYSKILRVADLTMDEHGEVSGIVKMTYVGSPALYWRQRSLIGDDESLKRELRTLVESLMPAGADVKVTSIDKLEDYDQPLFVNFQFKGAIGSATGKRLLVPADLFEANTKPTFPHEKRDIPVYFSYGLMNQDAVRIKFPPNFTVESLPTSDKMSFQKFAVYSLNSESTPNSFTIRRDYFLGEIYYKTEEYPELRGFYSKMENKDQETVILTTAANKPTPTGN
jgi:transglutaminase-like putative cysteine protease